MSSYANLQVEKVEAIAIAKELQYSNSVIDRISQATTSMEIDRALRSGRMEL